MKKIIITQSNYIPWKGFFDSINIVDEIILYDDAQYTRRDWRNRNKIKTRNGAQWLTIPVQVKGRYLQKINEIKISDPNWGRKHWDIIYHNYAQAKCFSKYKDGFEDLYLNSKEEYLSKINYDFLKAICAILGIKTKIRWSSEFNLLEGKNERLVDICKRCAATDYYTGPAAKAYINEELFAKEFIKVHYFNYSGYPEYTQLHGSFIHEVSIIDLLFNEGPNATKFMKSFK